MPNCRGRAPSGKTDGRPAAPRNATQHNATPAIENAPLEGANFFIHLANLSLLFSLSFPFEGVIQLLVVSTLLQARETKLQRFLYLESLRIILTFARRPVLDAPSPSAPLL